MLTFLNVLFIPGSTQGARRGGETDEDGDRGTADVLRKQNRKDAYIVDGKTSFSYNASL